MYVCYVNFECSNSIIIDCVGLEFYYYEGLS